MDQLERQINQIEAEKLKCSLRIFGVDEIESETYPLLSVLNDKLFCSTNPADNVTSHCISSATRVGDPSNKKPRMIVAKFEHHEDKLKLFKYRDVLRRSNIRIANDLSFWQRQQIKDMKKQGLIGYYKNGKLFTLPRRSHSNRKGDNTTRQGVRTLDDQNRERLRAISSSNPDIHYRKASTTIGATMSAASAQVD